jgi:hypothetical protein
MIFITVSEKCTLQFIWKQKRAQIATTTLRKMNNAQGITMPDFKLYYRPISIKTAWHKHKKRFKDQWNRIEHSDMNPCSNTHQIFEKGAKNT